MDPRLERLLQKAVVRTSGPWGKLRGERGGIMAHYTAASDISSVNFLLFDPACKVSYNWLILDDGTIITVAPINGRAFHAGVCRPSSERFVYKDANSYFYGIALAATTGDRATDAQIIAFRGLAEAICRLHGWNLAEVFTTHADEAWPRGRKIDTGPVLTLGDVVG